MVIFHCYVSSPEGITSDRLNPILRRDTVTAHLDNKWQVIENAFGMCQRGWGDWQHVKTVAEFLDLVDRQCTPREFWPFFELL